MGESGRKCHSKSDSDSESEEESSRVLDSSGRDTPFSKEQLQAIHALLPRWHALSVIELKNAPGNDTRLKDWKKDSAEQLLKSKTFKKLPTGVS